MGALAIRAPMRAPLVTRYLVPLSVVPLNAGNLGRVGGSLRAAYRSEDASPALPAALTVEVSDTLPFDDFVRVYTPVRPVYLSLVGAPDPLGNPRLAEMVAHATAAGTCVSLVTDGTRLDAGRAYALLCAGLAKMKVTVAAVGPDVGEAVLRNVERFVAMRDANRWPAPEIELQLVVTCDTVAQAGALVELCHRRFTNIAADIVLSTAGARAGGEDVPVGDADALAELRRARALAETYALPRTVGALDAALVQLTQDLSRAPCYVPWYTCVVAADGEVFPCGPHAARGTGVGNALRTPFAEVWNGAELRAFRARLRERRRDDAVCAGCRHEDGPLDRVFGAAARVPGLGAGSARSGR